MKTATTYSTLLARAVTALVADDDPDGPATWQALLLAAYAGAYGAGGVDWDLYTVAITEAVQELQADMAEPVSLTAGIPEPGPDSDESRREVADLVRRLADRYATAAAGDHGSPWRRLTWAKIAHRLDDAVAELT